MSSVAGLRGWADAAASCSAKVALTGFTQPPATEAGRIRACVLYPGATATSWGVWNPEERHPPNTEHADQPEDQALPADQVAELIAWIVAAPGGLVLNQVAVTPLHEPGRP